MTAIILRRTLQSGMPVLNTSRIDPVKGQEQFKKMAYPTNVENEDNPELLKKELQFAQDLEGKLDAMKISDAVLLAMVKAIETFDFSQEEILHDVDLPYYAMEALRRGFLNSVQASTVLNFWAALKYHGKPSDVQMIELSDDNIQAHQLIRDTFNKLPSSGDPDFMKRPPFLEGNKFDVFMKKVRALPKSEQRFLLVPDKQNTMTISLAIKNVGVNVFNRASDKKRIIPSTGIMQAFLDAEYGEEAVQLRPVIYQSTEMHIRDCSLSDTRDIEFPFPDRKGENRCPKTADDYPAPWYDFPYHDFYHSIQASAVGREFRRAGIIASDAIKQLADKSNEISKESLQEIGKKILDMEYGLFLNYYNGGPYTKIDAFWLQMNQEIQPIADKLYHECELYGYPVSHIHEGILKPYLKIYEAVTNSFKSLTHESFKLAVLNFREKLREVAEKKIRLGQIREDQKDEFLMIAETSTPILVLAKHLKL
jgi:hypothetical protein